MLLLLFILSLFTHVAYGDDSRVKRIYTDIGNTTYSDDGTYRAHENTSYELGNTIYRSDGESFTQIGTTVYGSDGTSCYTIGKTVDCN